MELKSIHTFTQSLLGQFIIGGATVAGIAFFANHLDNSVLAGVIAAVPIGMPSSIFVEDAKVKAYSKNLMLMSLVLMTATITNWYLLTYTKVGKYKSVSYSMLTFAVLGAIYAMVM